MLFKLYKSLIKKNIRNNIGDTTRDSNMKTEILICMAALLLIMQPALAQQMLSGNCIPQNIVDLGNIGKQEINITKNGTLEPGGLAWFRFNVVDPVKFSILIQPPEDGYYYEDEDYYYSSPTFGLVVYDKDMNYITSSKKIVLLNQTPGSYYARLDARPYKKINYSIMVSNVIEKESNDGLTEANDLGTISRRQYVVGSIDPEGDVDFYKFKLDEGKNGLLKLSAVEDVSEDLTLTLYKYNESEKRFMPDSSDEDSLSAFISSGLYYLRAQNYGGQSEDYYNYLLNISLSSLACDDKEPNDNYTTAVYMGALNASNESAILIKTACISVKNDIDYYNFTVPQNMSVSIDIDSLYSMYMCLYDSKKEKIYCSSYGIDEDLTPGNYYVTAKAYYSGRKAFSYDLSIEGKVSKD